MLFLREETKEETREKKKRSILTRKEEFKELSLSPRINNPADEILPYNWGFS